MRILIADNSTARKIQLRLINTDESSPAYFLLSKRYELVLDELPPEGKMIAKNGFLIPWTAK